MTTFGIAFPGQGAKREQIVSALRHHRGHPLVAEFLVRAGREPEDIDYLDTALAQPATYALGIAAAEEAFGNLATVPLALGHSLGELTAAACVGIVDVRSGFELALSRGELCRGHTRRTPGAMVAVMGADTTDIEWLRRSVLARTGGVLEIAGVNGRAQTVLSGNQRAVDEMIRIVDDHGFKSGVLPIAGSFHSPLMNGLLPDWRKAVEAVDFRVGTGTLVSTIDGQAHSDPAEIRELLVRALILPVRWLDAVRTARGLGVNTLWDAGPGDTLYKLGKRERTVRFEALDPTPVAS